MRGQRMWQTIRLYLTLSATKRTQYYKEKQIFYSMGDNCLVMDRKVPLYAKLIRIGNNVQIASNVHFNTHDITHVMLNNMGIKSQTGEIVEFGEKAGCISIGDNVFIGAGTSINYNVRIGNNVIIGACSLITKDVPDNTVVAGVPAKVIETFDEYLSKRMQGSNDGEFAGTETIDSHSIEQYWRRFNDSKNK